MGCGRLARGKDAAIVETTRPRVVRAARLVFVYVVWGRGRLARGKDAAIMETTRPRVVRVARPV